MAPRKKAQPKINLTKGRMYQQDVRNGRLHPYSEQRKDDPNIINVVATGPDTWSREDAVDAAGDPIPLENPVPETGEVKYEDVPAPAPEPPAPVSEDDAAE